MSMGEPILQKLNIRGALEKVHSFKSSAGDGASSKETL